MLGTDIGTIVNAILMIAIIQDREYFGGAEVRTKGNTVRRLNSHICPVTVGTELPLDQLPTLEEC